MSGAGSPAGDLGAALAALLELPVDVAALHALVAELRAEVAAMRQTMPPMLVSVPQAAERMGVSVPTVRRLIRQGRLPSVRIGSSVRVDLSRIRPVDDGEVARLAVQARRGALREVTRTR